MKNSLLALLLIVSVAINLTAQEITVSPTQYSVLTKKTATWCPNCGQQAWETFRQMIEENQEKAICIAAHFDDGSRLYSESAEAIVNAFDQSFGQPVFFFNSTRLSGRDANTASEAKGLVDGAFENTPVAQVGLYAGVNPDTRVVRVKAKVEFFQAATGNYKLAIYPIRKEVIEQQASRASDAAHKQIIENELMGATFGALIADGAINMGDTFEYEIEFTEYLSEIVSENLQLAAFIWQEAEGEHTFVNAFSIDTFEEETVSSLEDVEETFTVSVLQSAPQASLLVETTTAQQDVQIDLHSIDGKFLQTVWKGGLIKGQNQFELHNLNAGTYALFIRKGQQRITELFVIQ